MEYRPVPVELLAPARDAETGRSAVDFGADAVYIGGARFGARRGAANAADEVKRLADYAHFYGVRVYATLNTVLRDEELAAAERTARELIAAGADALIVQDMAVLRMNLEGIELHASTQCTNRSPEWVRFLGEAGFSRVILERSLSYEEVLAIRKATDVELECFVHGALCVGYSGRCYLSRTMSERSGNRGACSQPCRLPYDLVDGQGRTICTGRHLLSLHDLDLSARLGPLLDAGVTSFKIEGRLKEAGYVRNVVAWYRALLDRELALRPHLRRASQGESRPDFVPDPRRSFSRGSTEFFFSGRCADVACFSTPKSIGMPVGRVVRTEAGGFVLEGSEPVVAGDGLCFLGADGIEGASVNRVQGPRVTLSRPLRLAPGTEVRRNRDHRFEAAVLGSRTRRTIGVRVEASVSARELRVVWTERGGLRVEVLREGCFDEARSERSMSEILKKALACTGDTPYRVEEVVVASGVRFVPLSLVGEVRREGLSRLEEERRRRTPERRPAQEQPTARCPERELDGGHNVANRLAERFYRDHGVERIGRPLDFARKLTGACVMESAYCIRREIGACLKQGARYPGPLYLRHGRFRYRLHFDCERCTMSLIDETRTA